ncbi:hypothetical protein DSO57_1034275 [Entomophthora muscae]|uniref:Uncharacterized protein n=1 Tax=Entomophthora muscae TaxID=34485 RepID=A0ACC2SZS4_9FUNG|nr:hypothetical protein DSO57_1034275 [Entomophthora muscae]
MVSFVSLFAAAVAGVAFDINQMLWQVNEMRSLVGERPLRLNEKLSVACQKHSEDQARMKRLTHVGSDGSDFPRRVLLNGYNYRKIAENIAYGQRNVTEVMKTWLKNRETYGLLIDGAYTDFGAGMMDYYWTQNLGRE